MRDFARGGGFHRVWVLLLPLRGAPGRHTTSCTKFLSGWLPLRFRVPVDGGYTNLGTNFPVMRDLGQRLTHEIPNI